jgi:hypothetical protein
VDPSYYAGSELSAQNTEIVVAYLGHIRIPYREMAALAAAKIM